jgi:hypothetical protein
MGLLGEKMTVRIIESIILVIVMWRLWPPKRKDDRYFVIRDLQRIQDEQDLKDGKKDWL